MRLAIKIAVLLGAVLAGTVALVAFSGNTKLTVKEAISTSEWKYIVIHHSATGAGSTSGFDKYHRDQGWGGLAYHFVIGNGRGMPDGQVDKGWRWRQQEIGTHVSVNSWEYNIHGIGVCLVGNFEKASPSPKQWSSLVDLVANLAKEHQISTDQIITHQQVPFDDGSNRTEQTLCPGKHFDLERLRTEVKKKLTEAS